MPAALIGLMRVQVTPCERYRLRVTTWGSGAPPHAVPLPGLSADWRALAPQIRTLRRLGWTVHVVALPGVALSPRAHGSGRDNCAAGRPTSPSWGSASTDGWRSSTTTRRSCSGVHEARVICAADAK